MSLIRVCASLHVHCSLWAVLSIDLHACLVYECK